MDFKILSDSQSTRHKQLMDWYQGSPLWPPPVVDGTAKAWIIRAANILLVAGTGLTGIRHASRSKITQQKKAPSDHMLEPDSWSSRIRHRGRG